MAFGASVGAATLSGCGLFDSEPEPPPAPDPLTGLLAETNALVAKYTAALTAFPAIARTLTPIRDAHQAHADAVVAIMSPKPVVPSGSPIAASAPPVAADQKTAVADLRTAERAALKKALDTCVSAPAKRATLLGEIAAARSGHLEVLA